MRPRSLTVAGIAALALAGCGGDGAGKRMPEHFAVDAGLGVDASSTWARVQPEIARFTRVCWYDRSGMGRSDERPGPRTSDRMVSELYALLGQARVPLPVVLAGASFGA